VRAALHRVGIATRNSGRVGNIEITGKDDAARFAGIVGSDHPDKAPALARMSDVAGRSASRSDGIPAGALLREAREACGMGQRSFERGNYVSLYEREESTPPRRRLASIVSEMEQYLAGRGSSTPRELSMLRQLVDGDTRFTSVESVEDVPG